MSSDLPEGVPSAGNHHLMRRDAVHEAGISTPRAGYVRTRASDILGEDQPAQRDVRKYGQILRDNWPLIAISTVVITAAVALSTALKPPVYRASGTIEIRKQSAEVVPVEALFQFERISDQYLQTQYALLQSPVLIRRALEDSTLASGLAGEPLTLGDSAAARATVDTLAESARDRLLVEPLSGSRLVKVSFEAHDPQLAASFVNAVVGEYVEMRQESGAEALDRFAVQADSIRVDMLRKESQLQAFVRRNGLGVLVGASGELESVPQDRLRRLEQELTVAEAEGIRAAAILQSAQQSDAANVDSDLLRTLRDRIAALQGEYARLRSTFTDSFPRARQLREELAQLDVMVAREQRRVSSAMGGQARAADARRELLRRAVDEQRAVMDDLSAKHAEYDRLKRDLDGQKQLYGTLQQKRKEATVAAAMASVDVSVLEAATPPLSPVSPLPKRDIPLGAMVGLLLGVGMTFARSYWDTSVRTLDEAESISDVPVLALIPSVRPALAASTPKDRLTGKAANQADLDDLGEAFRGLRTSVLFESMGPVPRNLLITSSAPGEGKTFVATNLAISLASLGRRVLLIDADLRRPSVHRAFGLTCRVGLAQCLNGDVPWEGALHRNVVPGLDVLPSRSESPNPCDLLSSPALSRLLEQVGNSYDFVLIDAPALFINVPDARLLARAADGVLLVVRSGVTPRDLVRRLTAQAPNLCGLVLNGYDLRQLPASYASYGQRVATV